MKIIQFSSIVFLITALSTCQGKIEYQEVKKKFYLSGFFAANEKHISQDFSNMHTFPTYQQAEQFCNKMITCRGVSECTTQNSTIVFIPRTMLGIKNPEDQDDSQDKLNCSHIKNEFAKFEEGKDCKYEESSLKMKMCSLKSCHRSIRSLKKAQQLCSKHLQCGGVGRYHRKYKLFQGFQKINGKFEKVINKTVSWVKQSCDNKV